MIKPLLGGSATGVLMPPRTRATRILMPLLVMTTMLRTKLAWSEVPPSRAEAAGEIQIVKDLSRLEFVHVILHHNEGAWGVAQGTSFFGTGPKGLLQGEIETKVAFSHEFPASHWTFENSVVLANVQWLEPSFLNVSRPTALMKVSPSRSVLESFCIPPDWQESLEAAWKRVDAAKPPFDEAGEKNVDAWQQILDDKDPVMALIALDRLSHYKIKRPDQFVDQVVRASQGIRQGVYAAAALRRATSEDPRVMPELSHSIDEWIREAKSPGELRGLVLAIAALDTHRAQPVVDRLVEGSLNDLAPLERVPVADRMATRFRERLRDRLREFPQDKIDDVFSYLCKMAYMPLSTK